VNTSQNPKYFAEKYCKIDNLKFQIFEVFRSCKDKVVLIFYELSHETLQNASFKT